MTGVFPIGVTPFDEEGTVDFDSFRNLVLDYLQNGVSGIVVPAVASEVDKLSPSERRDLTRVAVETVEGRIPVIGGILGETGSEAARHAEEALFMGCSGLLCRAPGGMVRDGRGLKDYFVEAASAGADCFVIQDLSWNDFGMEIDLILELYRSIDSFRTIKIEVARTGYKASRLLESSQGKIGVWSGWAMTQMIESLERGIDGYCPSAFNRPFVRVFELYSEEKKKEAEELFETLLPYLAWSRQHIDINLHLLKRLCVRKGLFRTSRLREPFVEFDKHHEAYAARLIERMVKWEAI